MATRGASNSFFFPFFFFFFFFFVRKKGRKVKLKKKGPSRHKYSHPAAGQETNFCFKGGLIYKPVVSVTDLSKIQNTYGVHGGGVVLVEMFLKQVPVGEGLAAEGTLYVVPLLWRHGGRWRRRCWGCPPTATPAPTPAPRGAGPTTPATATTTATSTALGFVVWR